MSLRLDELHAGAGEHGYTCGLSGKWNLGDSTVPQHGFTRRYAHHQGGGSYFDAPMIRDGEMITEPGYLSDAITDDAIGFGERRARATLPFSLSVNHTAPHSPWIDTHPREIVDSYNDCPFETMPRDPVRLRSVPGLAPAPESNHWREQLKGYFAAVEAMGATIDRIVARLDALGLRSSTLMVFLNDNGFSTEHHGFSGIHTVPTSSTISSTNRASGPVGWATATWERSLCS